MRSIDDIHFRNSRKTRIEDTDDDETDELDKYIVDYLDYGYSINDFDPTLDKIVKGRLNVNDVIKRHRRVRRSVTKKDTIEHVTKIMESIEEELDDLKVISEVSILSINVILLHIYYRIRIILFCFSKLKFVTCRPK